MVIFCFIYDFANHLIPQRVSVAQFTYDLTQLFGMLTSIANPILYSLLNESFRDVAKEKYLPRCVVKKSEADIEMKDGNRVVESVSGPSQTIEVEDREREVVTKRRLKISASKVEQVFNEINQESNLLLNQDLKKPDEFVEA